MKDEELPSLNKIFEEKLSEVIEIAFPRGAFITMLFGWLSFILILIAYLFGITTMKLQLIFIFFVSVYASLVCLLIKMNRGFLRGSCKYLLLLVPLFFPTIFFLIANLLLPERMLFNLTGPFSFSYFLIIIMSGLFFNYRYSVAAGFIAGIGYFLAYLIGRDNLYLAIPSTKEEIGLMFSPAAFLAKSLMMVFSGFLVGVGIRVAKKLVSRILDEEQQRQHITDTFGMIVDPRVRDLMIEKKIETGGETRENTVLFADIRGFTSFSQKMSPPELFSFMKEYFDLMNAQIREEDGTIMEYVGDEVMVLFGAPLPLEDHAEKACLAALKMQEALRLKSPLWEREGMPSLKTGVGIHTGLMLVGCIGSSERHKYGALGDSVNLASRLQSLTKEYGVSIIASEETLKHCPGKFHTRILDRVIVRGRTEEITIHEVISTSDKELDPLKNDFINAYDKAFSSYLSGSLSDSLVLFRQALELNPEDRAARRLIEKIEHS